jgi:cation diffusion facilitator family transporter
LALGVAVESIHRLLAPVSVHYSEALFIASIGLAVNIASAALLHEPHGHEHHHGEADHHHDHNLRAAYVHVVADAATSVLAILALASGMMFGISWADPLVGIVGAVVIASWSLGLIRDSALVLLDAQDDPDLAREITALVEREMGAHVFDLHLWRLGPGHHGLIVSLVSPIDGDNERVKRLLCERYPSLSHVTVEIAVCGDCAPQPAA